MAAGPPWSVAPSNAEIRKTFTPPLDSERKMANHYEVPNWAGKPPVGLHLDVLKVDKLVQKLMIDEKKCYLFGRNPQMNDFVIDHASCSRVHSAFVYHKHLQRAFLVDLGSTHGTFIGNMRIDANKPTQLPIDSVFHFGASTRRYILRERPQTGSRPIMEELERSSEDVEGEGGLLGLPETETELDNLTEFNTAHNRRISMLGIQDDEIRNSSRKRRKKGVSFNEDEEIINPEDVDPSVGRFRNLVHTTVVPTKRLKTGMEGPPSMSNEERLQLMKHLTPASVMSHLYRDLPPETNTSSHSSHHSSHTLPFSSVMASRLGLPLPNPAPDVDMSQETSDASGSASLPSGPAAAQAAEGVGQEPKKKKYAKEAWPGKKPMPALLV